MFPATLTVSVVNVGTVGVVLILSVLVAVALLKEVIVLEPEWLTIPAALLVMPVIVPKPWILTVPVLVKFASAVVIAPEPVIVAVPELAKVVIEEALPIFTVPLFDNEPAPDKAVLTVRVPELV